MVSKLVNRKQFLGKPFCLTGHEVCCLGCSSLSGLVVIVLVRKMVVLERRCKALFVFLMLTVSFFLMLTVSATGNASKSICRYG